MKKMTFIITVLLVVILAVPVFANSQLGMKGLINMPVADTQTKGKLSLGLQMIGDAGYVSANYGIGQNLEGFVGFNSDSGDITGGIKVRIIRETRYQPALTVGLMNTNIFVVASKIMDYKTNIRGHLGFGTGDQLDGIYLGFNKLYNPITISSSNSRFKLPVTDFKLEYFAEKINIGADFYLNDSFKLNVGISNLKNVMYGIEYSSLF
ncbi:MAG: YjbH domain-containing protein [Halanaerobiales bacterium]|nr:YjbH domain-containing protein [Halanaerobiales bacterium]